MLFKAKKLICQYKKKIRLESQTQKIVDIHYKIISKLCANVKNYLTTGFSTVCKNWKNRRHIIFFQKIGCIQIFE